MDQRKAPSQGFTGTVNLQLTDLLQMVCLSRSDLLIKVQSSEGSGAIYVKRGEVCHATTDHCAGEKALFSMLGWEDGRFEMLPFEEVKAYSVNKPWEHLLVEAMRRRDEKREASGGEGENQPGGSREGGGVNEERKRPSEGERSAAGPTEDAGVIRVLIVDDSTFFAKQLKRILENDPCIQVAGIAKNGKEALDFLATHPSIDLITLDIQMPVMQGDTTLKHIMIRRPIPVLMISSFQPESLGEIFEFLQLGAIDFISKPASNEDMAVYGEKLCDLAKRAAQAEVSRFRRWRKAKTSESAPEAPGEDPASKILLILGAEGAYMDWFRLPLAALARRGLVIGLQKVTAPFLHPFCRLLERETGVRAAPVQRSEWIHPGRFYMSNAGQQVQLELVEKTVSLGIELFQSEALSWHEGVEAWIEQLGRQAGEAVSVHVLSAAHHLDSDFVERMLERKVRFFLPPAGMVMCSQYMEQVEEYMKDHPRQIVRSTPESLMEVWLKNE